MAVSHIFSNAVADWTGTVTVFNSAGATGTVAATAIVRPSDWNSAHNQFYTLTGNTTGNSTASGTNVIWAGSGGISIGGSTGSIVVSGPTPNTYNFYDPFSAAPMFPATQGQATLVVNPYELPNVQFDRIGLRVFHRNASNVSGSFSLSNWVGIYTKNGSTLSLLSSTSNSYAFTNSGTQGIYNSIGGVRIATIGWTGTLSAGDYWFGIGTRSSTGGANCTVLQMCADPAPNLNFTAGNPFALMTAFSGIFSEVSNASKQFRLGAGVYSVSTAGIPNSIGFTDLVGSNIFGSVSNASGILYQPMFMFANGTV